MPYSLGGTFGARLAEAVVTDPAGDEVLDGLRQRGVFDGAGNLQFKNKFRTQNTQLYLCRPLAADANRVVDILMMLANPETHEPSQPPDGGSGGAPVPGAGGPAPALGGQSASHRSASSPSIRSSSTTSADGMDTVSLKSASLKTGAIHTVTAAAPSPTPPLDRTTPVVPLAPAAAVEKPEDSLHSSKEAPAGESGEAGDGDELREARRRRLEEVGFNVLALATAEVPHDLKTDSWAQLDTPALRQRMGGLAARLGESADLEARLQEVFPFPFTVLTRSGREAEELLWAAWAEEVEEGQEGQSSAQKPGMEPRGEPGKEPRKQVVQNLLFPSQLYHQIDNGFVAKELPRPEVFRLDSSTLFRGGFDLQALGDYLDERRNSGKGQPCLACLELSNNGSGGYPISLEDLTATRKLLKAAGVPLMVDVTRMLENGVFASEAGSRDPWSMARQLCASADVLTASLAKNFAINIGGIVATHDEALYHRLRRVAEDRQLALDPTQEKFVALALEDQDLLLRNVRERMEAVRVLNAALAKAEVPILEPASGHCVVLNVAAMEPFRSRSHSRAIFPRLALRAHGDPGRWPFVWASARWGPSMDWCAWQCR